MTQSPIEIHKFGGTSVGSPERITAAARIVADRAADARICIVSSAMSRVTDQLEHVAATGDPETVADISDRHRAVARELDISPSTATWRDLDAIIGELEETASIARRLVGSSRYPGFGGVPPGLHDRIVSAGERLAVRLLAEAIRREGPLAEPVDADSFLATSADFGEADPLHYEGDPAAKETLGAAIARAVIPVVTGFIGRGPDGLTRLLGRGGSDFSAALLAAALDADRLVIWTDVEGVYTCDPRLVPGATPIERLSYREAGEMAFFGSKVLHPRTIIPVSRKGIPTTVRSTLAPRGASTHIDLELPRAEPADATPSTLAAAVSAMPAVSLLSLEGGGLAGVAGVSARLFAALAA
ncbi:MAG: aspartate kinase, partial [Planctomycetota bacterium]